MITQEQLAAWRQLCERATPGPWYTELSGETYHGLPMDVMIAATAPSKSNRVYANPPGGSFPGNDQRFIAAAREIVPALISAYDEHGREIDNLRQQLAAAESRAAQLAAAESRAAQLAAERDAAVTRLEDATEIIQRAQEYIAEYVTSAPLNDQRWAAHQYAEYTMKSFLAVKRLQAEHVAMWRIVVHVCPHTDCQYYGMENADCSGHSGVCKQVQEEMEVQP